jgi:Uma2 family endonuclease
MIFLEVPQMLTAKTKSGRRIASGNGTVLPKDRMTEEEFVAWAFSDEDIRAEWEDGKVILMAPVSDAEDDINGWLLALLRLFVERGDLGVIKGPNFFVRFASQKRRRIPDLLFISKPRQQLIRPTYLEGAPDVAFEIVSKDSQTRDRRKKYQEYEKAGVREYWMIDPVTQTLEAYVLKRGKYVEIEEADQSIRSSVLSGFYLKSQWLFRRPLPKIHTLPKDLGITG